MEALIQIVPDRKKEVFVFTFGIGISSSELRFAEEAVSRLTSAGFHSRQQQQNEIFVSIVPPGPPLPKDFVLDKIMQVLRVANGSTVWKLRSLNMTGAALFSTLAISKAQEPRILADADTEDSDLTIGYLHSKKIAYMILSTTRFNHELGRTAAAFQESVEIFMITMGVHRKSMHVRSLSVGADVTTQLDAIDSLVPMAMGHIARHWKLTLTKYDHG